MPTVIPVKSKYASRDLWFDPAGTGAQEGDHVICATERGQEIGLATMDALELGEEELAQTIGESRLKSVLRIATQEDLNHASRLADQGERDLVTFRRLVHESGLDMKPVGVEHLFGGDKVVCYFSADERVDFRQLIRDLARELHGRIDMRQIGVREEAAIVGGYAHCGQELCCARFGHQFEPVSIRMAKEQDLPLNSTKISGACGRLMCCLRYEFEAYRDFKSRAPKRNAVIDTPLGKAKIVEYDTPKEQIALRLENGKQIRVPLSGMQASEAAVRKSEELHCPCRPDTVTREALDRLESPDVQMALAELDRANGVGVEQGFDSSDIFVKIRHRRSHGRQEPGAGEFGSGARGAAGPRSSAQDAPRPRRRHQDDAADAGPEQGPATTPRQRRRKKRPGAGMGDSAQRRDAAEHTQAQGGGASQPATNHRRRRHHSSDGSEGQAGGGQQATQQAPKAGERPRGTQSTRRKRHPGDHGGQQQASQQAQQPNGGRSPRRRGQDRQPGGPSERLQQRSGEPGGSSDGAEKARRRRRRGGRGRGQGGSEGKGGSAPSDE